MNCYILGVAIISIKNELVIQHIRELPEGSRISVRELSARLQVSEGTAYKAVKEAQQLGLVMVKPKAGTVRISVPHSAFETVVTAAETARTLGLSVNVGKDFLNRRIRRMVVCDGSEQDMQRQLNGAEPSECLCLCGDRPDLQNAVLESGANLLLTGGARASWVLSNLAEKMELLVLSSPQSAASLLRLFESEFSGAAEETGSDRVADWMQTPAYMYCNDIVADWQQFYVESELPGQYPVVDDDLEIIGALELWKAASATPSQKLSSVLADTEQLDSVSLEDSIRDVARRFVVNGQLIAPVLEGRRMMGMVSATDLLRYYMCAEHGQGAGSADSFLVRDGELSGGDTEVFRIQLPESAVKNSGHLENELLISAAESHLRQLGRSDYRLTNGTFMSFRPLKAGLGLCVESCIKFNNMGSAVLEMELYDEKNSYAKLVITASAQEG